MIENTLVKLTWILLKKRFVLLYRRKPRFDKECLLDGVDMKSNPEIGVHAVVAS